MSIKMLYEKDGTTPMGSALNVGYPQTSGGTSLTNNSEWEATGNGWVKVHGIPETDKSNIAIKIDGDFITSILMTAGSGQWCRIASPVRKGQKVIATFPTGGGNLLSRPRNINSTQFLHMGFARVFASANRGCAE